MNNIERAFLARSRCNVDRKRREVEYVDIPLAKGILRKLTVRNIDESQGSHRIVGIVARKHYFNLYNASGGFGLAMHRAGNKENRGHFNRITPTPLDRSNRGIREFSLIVRMKLIVLA